MKANLDAQKAGLASIAMKVIDKINVVDDLTVDVEMTQPWAGFPSLLASQEGYMISPASIGAADAETHPVGTGPFVFDSWDRGSKLVTKKNPNYWQAGKPYLDKLEFRVLNDPAARSNALESGEVNMMFTDQPQADRELQGQGGLQGGHRRVGRRAEHRHEPGRSEPFDNINARKALVHATDSTAIAESFGDGILTPTDQPFSETEPVPPDGSALRRLTIWRRPRRTVAQYTSETGKPLEFTLTTFTGRRQPGAGAAAPGPVEAGRHHEQHRGRRRVHGHRRHHHGEDPGGADPELRVPRSGLVLHVLALGLHRARSARCRSTSRT